MSPFPLHLSLSSYHLDLIITDIKLPDIDGVELIQQLRQFSQHSTVPILASSANVLSEACLDCQVAGADAFLPKPIDINDLLKMLQALLNLEWQYQRTDATPSARSTPQASVSAGQDAALVTPTAEVMERLYDLAMRGHMKGILQEVEMLQKDTDLMPFAERIRAIAQSFQEKELLALISQYKPL